LRNCNAAAEHGLKYSGFMPVIFWKVVKIIIYLRTILIMTTRIVFYVIPIDDAAIEDIDVDPVIIDPHIMEREIKLVQ